MTHSPCPQPLSGDDIVDYWAGELDVQTEARVEEHVFACGTCAAAFAQGEAMASGIRALVRAGMFQALVPEAVLNRLARDGARLRTFTLSPGDVVPCAVWEDDDVIVTRLRGDFSGIGSVRVVYPGRLQTLPSRSTTRIRASPIGWATCSVPTDAWKMSPAASTVLRSTPCSR